MINKSISQNDENLDVSSLKLIGYYKSANPKLNFEQYYPKEAEELGNLLKNSFSASESISTLNPEFFNELNSSVLVLKNYSGHLFAFCPNSGLAQLSDVRFEKEIISRPPEEYQQYFSPGEPFVSTKCQKIIQQNNTSGLSKITVDVLDIVNHAGVYYFEVDFSGIKANVRLLPFQAKLLDRAKEYKQLVCIYQGIDKDGDLRVIQDRHSFIKDLCEEDTVQIFRYLETRIDNNEQKSEYHIVRDEYGLKHRLYANLPTEKRLINAEVELYISGINKKNKTLLLSLYNPNLGRIEKEWFDANRIFNEIAESDNKAFYFDCYFTEDIKKCSKLVRDLIIQYNEKSNLWLFTFMNIIDNEFIETCIRKHQIEELSAICIIMIKLQKWMIEGSTYLDLFSVDTKSSTIEKSSYQIQKFQRLLIAIEIVRKGEQNKYLGEIVSAIKKSGRIALQREERIEVMINILRIYPDYFTQDIVETCKLVQALLMAEDGTGEHELKFIAGRLDYYVEADVRKMRSTTIRSNEIDTTQTLLIKEVLALLCIKVLILQNYKYKDILEARASKARFFRFLSFVCPTDMQALVLKAGVDALVGVIDDTKVFTWNNAYDINPIKLCNLTSQATILDSNLENDFFQVKESGKSGIIRLDSTGFTIVPYKQCLTNFRFNLNFIENIRIIHHLETLPIKLGTMFDVSPLIMDSDAVNQYILWRDITKYPEKLVSNVVKQYPTIGDNVLVYVKAQNQLDKLKYMIFVTVIDQRFTQVDGIITVKDITPKWIDDARKLFNEGDFFYAIVNNITEEGKYSFSIRESVSKYASSISKVEEDVKHIILKSEDISALPQMTKSFIQELILLIDMRLRKESNLKNKLILIGYAHCLSSLASDPKSYYYDFLLRYYAVIDKFVTNKHNDIEISFVDTINSKFVDISNKRHLIELLSFANNQSEDGLKALQTLAEDESRNDVGKLAAMLTTYIYALKAGFTTRILEGLKEEINECVTNSDNLDLSALSIEVPNDNQENTEFGTPENSNEDLNEKLLTEELNEQTDKTDNIDIVQKATINQFISNSRVSLVMDIFEDQSIIISEDLPTSEKYDSVISISIPECSYEGILLLVNTSGAICKMSISDISKLNRRVRLNSKINPFNLSNHFVVPSECYIGSILTTLDGTYFEMYSTNNLVTSDTQKLNYLLKCKSTVVRHQPFILPLNCIIDDKDSFIGKSKNREFVPSAFVEEIKNYGVYI